MNGAIHGPVSGPSRAAIERAGRTLAEAVAHRDSLTPRQAAEEAHVPGGPTVDQLEARIAAMRGLPVPLRSTA